MSNNCIYQNHYVYIIEHIKSKKYYIGARSTNLLPDDDLGKKYFSSSTNKEFIKDQKENNHHYKYTVLRNFNNRDDAILHEVRLHNEKQVHLDPNSYNMAKQTSAGFSTVGKFPARDKDGNMLHISVDDPRLESGELSHFTSGNIVVYDENDKRHIINENEYDPNVFFKLKREHKKCKDDNGSIFSLHHANSRIKNGEVQIAKYATDGSDTYMVFSDDPRILNGELQFIDKKKKIYVYDNDDKRHRIYEDDYDPNIFFKLELNYKKCKDKDGIILILYNTNSKIKNGEVQVAQPSTDGVDTYLVFPDDPRILNGKLKFIKKKKSKSMITVYDNNDKRHIINKDDYDSKKFYRLPSHYKKCKDAEGNISILVAHNKKIKNNEVQVAKLAIYGKDTYLVFPDDPRILNGELKFK